MKEIGFSNISVKNKFSSVWYSTSLKQWLNIEESLDPAIPISSVFVNPSGKKILSIGINPSTYNETGRNTENLTEIIEYKFKNINIKGDTKQLIENFKNDYPEVNLLLNSNHIPIYKEIWLDQLFANWCFNLGIVDKQKIPGKLDNTRERVLKAFSLFTSNNVQQIDQLDLIPFRTKKARNISNDMIRKLSLDKDSKPSLSNYLDSIKETIDMCAENADYIFCGWGKMGFSLKQNNLFEECNSFFKKFVKEHSDKTVALDITSYGQPCHPVQLPKGAKLSKLNSLIYDEINDCYKLESLNN